MNNLINAGAVCINVGTIVQGIRDFKKTECPRKKIVYGLVIALNVFAAAVNFKSFADGNLLPEDDEEEIEE